MAACSSVKIVADGPEASARYIQRPNPGLSSGDRAKLTFADGRQMTLKVTTVTADSVSGTVDGDDRIVSASVADITRIEKRTSNPGQTTALVIALLLVAGLLAAAEAYDDLFDALRGNQVTGPRP
jgi:hypothetical protein